MERINCILNDPSYLDYVRKIEKAEETRIFCRHDMAHFLDVCRIGWILNLERKANIDKELIYAVGLLHDTGRWLEYETGQDHAQASVELSGPILRTCGFSGEETELILSAIGAHRKKGQDTELSRILYEADKKSRMCLTCDAKGECKHFQNGETFFFTY